MAEKEAFRARLEDGLRAKLDLVLDKKGITQVGFANRFITWFLGLDDLLQSIVLGQVNSDGQVKLLESMLKEARGDEVEPLVEQSRGTARGDHVPLKKDTAG